MNKSSTALSRPAIDPEFARLIPPLTDAELERLEANLLAEGCRDPLVVWGETGVLLDGHHRLEICEKHGMPYRTVLVELPDRPAAMDWMLRNQLGRRNLSREQFTVLLGRRYNLQKKQGERTDLTSGQNDQKSTTAEKIAAEHGVTEATVRRAAKAVDALPDVSPAEQAEILRAARDANRERLQKRRERHLEEGRTSVPAPSFDAPTFRVVYADPPWSYDQNRLVGWGMAEDHYPTMSLDDLKAIRVADMALPDSVLFLWATSPMLDDAIDLMRAWGFKYKSSIVWDKGRPFLGSYVHISHELLLIGTRGSCAADVKHTSGSVFSFERSRHSAKPEEFRALIDSMYTFGNRIELFHRGDPPEGWHTWGNEAGDG